MQWQIGLLTAAVAIGAALVFAVGLTTFRLRPTAKRLQLRATVTMWAGVVGVGALLCCAGTLLFLPV